VATLSRVGLSLGHAASSLVGGDLVARLSGGTWKRGMPHAGKTPTEYRGDGDPVVYFPACGGRIFGANSTDEATLPEVIMDLLVRAGYAPRLPTGFDKLCCGQMMASKGMSEEADAMAEAVTTALLKAADNGQGGYYPVIMDASTCSVRMQKVLAGRLTLLDFHEFAHDALLPRLRITRKPGPIALHINCSLLPIIYTIMHSAAQCHPMKTKTYCAALCIVCTVLFFVLFSYKSQNHSNDHFINRFSPAKTQGST
jgi:D-lactate dehydrogenase